VTQSVAIIGCGPWGLAVLERLICNFSMPPNHTTPLKIHIVEPKTPGVGVYMEHLPEYFLLNTVSGQIDLFGYRYLNSDFTATYQPLSFFEWLDFNGYKINDYGSYRDVERTDFCPRAWLGRYLQWVYETLVSNLPTNLTVQLHPDFADQIISEGNREVIMLRNNGQISADFAIITLGHAESLDIDCNKKQLHGKGQPFNPFPYQRLLTDINDGQTVIVSGMGLTSIDVISTLTIGKGGRFTRSDNGQLNYHPSGREPLILQCSRSGLPYLSRPTKIEDSVSSYTPVFVTQSAIDEIRKKGELDFRADILPLLWKEMINMYYNDHSVLKTEFFPEDIFFGNQVTYTDSASYQKAVIHQISVDILNAKDNSPEKKAIEMIRVLRDVFRYATDFGGLSRASFHDYHKRIVPLLYRAVVGPPVHKSEELRALVEAGVLQHPFAQNPKISYQESRWIVQSTSLKIPLTRTADHLVLGYIPSSLMELSSVLIENLLKSGRFKRLSDQVDIGIEITPKFHPLTAGNKIQERLYVLGLMTEGSRNLNLYIPSPQSRLRAFHDADSCVKDIADKLVGLRGATEHTNVMRKDVAFDEAIY